MAEALREAFLAERKKGIGGSDVAAIFGLDSYRTPEDVWLEKTGQVIPIDTPSGDKERGIMLEPVAAERYAERKGVRLLRLNTIVHAEYPWMRANIDRLEVAPEGPNSVVEIKCPSLGMYSKIKREGLGDSWKLQMQHYLCVTGLPRGVWVIFCADRWELLDFPMERDEGVIEMLIEKEREFWTLCETMTPPPPVVREIAEEPEIVEIGSVTRRRDADFVEAIAQLREAKTLKMTAEQVEALAIGRIRELVGEKPGIYEGPGARLYFREQKGRNSFDKNALARVKPIDRDKLFAVLAQFNEYSAAETLGSEDIDLDLDRFNKQGAPFKTLRSYFFGD